MKRILVFFILFLIAGSITALGYSLYQIGMIGEKSNSDQTIASVSTSSTQVNANEKDLSWMKEIKGISEDDAKTQQVTSTTKEDEMKLQATSTESISGSNATTQQTPDATSTDTEQSIQDLGKSDALTSTEYDYAFKDLALSVELRHGNVFLSWTPATKETFINYKIIRSTTDENPYFSKTTAIKTQSDVTETAYTDSKIEDGKTYYYRICMTKQGKPPACGNIVKVNL